MISHDNILLKNTKQLRSPTGTVPARSGLKMVLHHEAIIYINNSSIFMGTYRNSATHMGNNQVQIFIFLSNSLATLLATAF